LSRQDQCKLQDSFYKDFGLLNEELTFLAGLGSTKSKCKSSQLCQMELYEAMHKDEDGLLSAIHPLAFAAKANKDDMPNCYQAMNGPNAEGLYKAMGDEMESLEKLDPWEIVPESDAPLGANVLDSTWAFKRK
jgi:hypothetical protein